MHIQINDTIKVLTGNDKGRTGKVVKVDTKKGTVLIEGINQYKRAMKAQGNQEGGLITLPRPLAASKVMVVCPHCQKATRPLFSGTGRDQIRLCRHCQKPLSEAVTKKAKKK